MQAPWKGWWLITLLIASGWGDSDIAMLLKNYRSEADLSRVTKKDLAGAVHVFARSDLERMQARTLGDLLAMLNILNFTRSARPTWYYKRASIGVVPSSATRVYIDDHDLSSSSFGSALLLWAQAPLELFDHVEVYKDASSIQFGNEAGVIVIRLYTKTPERDAGSKVRMTADTYGGLTGDAYNGQWLDTTHSLFMYGHADRMKNETYDQSGQTIRSGHKNGTLYAALRGANWRFQVMGVKIQADPFFGSGRRARAEGGGLDAWHGFVNATYRFDPETVLEISYDRIDYERDYREKNGLGSGIYRPLDRLVSRYTDDIGAIVFHTTMHLSSQDDVYGGAFYKYKGFRRHADLTWSQDGRVETKKVRNHLHLFSLFGEWTHWWSDTLATIVGLKGDAYLYDQRVDDRHHLIARAGVVYEKGKVQAKLFGTIGYLPTPFYQLDNPTANAPTVNGTADDMSLDILNASLTYRFTEKHEGIIRIAQGWAKDMVHYHPHHSSSPQWGFMNVDKSAKYRYLEAIWNWRMDTSNRLHLDWFHGYNFEIPTFSYDWGAHAFLYNTIEKWDIFNGLTYWHGYDDPFYHRKMRDAWEYTLAVKYHVSDDVSFGVRGENLFDRSREENYRGVADPIPVTDRRVIANLEILF